MINHEKIQDALNRVMATTKHKPHCYGVVSALARLFPGGQLGIALAACSPSDEAGEEIGAPLMFAHPMLTTYSIDNRIYCAGGNAALFLRKFIAENPTIQVARVIVESEEELHKQMQGWFTGQAPCCTTDQALRAMASYDAN